MNNHFYTESLNVAAWLVSHGYSIKNTTKLDRQLIFYFERDDNIQNVLNKYNDNLELKRFITAFKQVREAVRNS